MSDAAQSHRDLLALCCLADGDDRCEWGIIARQAHRERTLDSLKEGLVIESNERAHRTGWLISTASPVHWASAYDRADAELEAASTLGARMTTVLDDDYPTNLRFIHNLPPFLFYRGTLNDQLDAHSVAVVGTRKASADGLDRARRMARRLVEHGVSIVSGLARGIDTAAHQAALDAGGRTIAVFGTGITMVYPAENAKLVARIIDTGGLVVSQFFPTASPSAWTFPKRNEVTSGISQGTVVIEASQKSGARMQARLAYEHGKQVFLIESLATAQEWARAMLEARRAISVRGFDDLARELVTGDRLLAASKELHLEPFACSARRWGSRPTDPTSPDAGAAGTHSTGLGTSAWRAPARPFSRSGTPAPSARSRSIRARASTGSARAAAVGGTSNASRRSRCTLLRSTG